MDSDQSMIRSQPPWPGWRRILTALCALGFALSAYLGWLHVTGGSPIGCGGGSPCEQVLSGRWSAIGGVLPVSGLAAGAYLAMLLASFFTGPATEAPVRRLAWGAMLVLAGAAAGSAVWFTIVQKWFIGAFCPYCMATHLNGVLLAGLAIWQAPKPARALAAGGLAAAGVLAILQVSIAPAPVFRGGESPETRTALDPRVAPLVGSPDARHVVTVLFDYQCPHCQRLHLLLEEIAHRYGGKLAFALGPVPLSTQCNPYVTLDTDRFKDSCELAKIGLAVWRAKREAFPAFDRWMFTPEPGRLWRPRLPDAAKAKAIELVGQAKFDAARSDPWVENFLQSSVRVYGDTGANAVPKLIYRSRWIVPEPTDADELLAMMRAQLALPPP